MTDNDTTITDEQPKGPGPMPEPEHSLEMYKDLIGMDPDNQAMPILLWGGADGVSMIAMGDLPEGGMQPALYNAIPGLASKLGNPEWLVLSTEAWGKEYGIEDRPTTLRPGQLSEERAAGDEKVYELVMITATDGESAWSSQTRFTRTEDGIEWGETHLLRDENLGGGVLRIMTNACTIDWEAHFAAARVGEMARQAAEGLIHTEEINLDASDARPEENAESQEDTTT